MYERNTEIVVAFNIESAMAMTMKKYAGNPFQVKSLGSAPVKDVLKGVDLQNRLQQEAPLEKPVEISPPEPAPVSTVEQFIANLKLSADEFVHDPEVKKQLKEIIDGIEKSLPKKSEGKGSKESS